MAGMALAALIWCGTEAVGLNSCPFGGEELVYLEGERTEMLTVIPLVSENNQYLKKTLLKLVPWNGVQRFMWKEVCLDFTVKNKSENYEKKFVLYFIKQVIIIL